MKPSLLENIDFCTQKIVVIFDGGWRDFGFWNEWMAVVVDDWNEFRGWGNFVSRDECDTLVHDI